MHRRLLLLAVAIGLLASCEGQPQPPPPIEVYFSPNGGVTDAVVRQVDAARQTIFVQAYSFTSLPIARALVRAQHRGVTVHVILDRSQQTETSAKADLLGNAGIRVLIDAEHALAHNKIMIIDAATILTGSFNFTRQAERENAENLLVIRDPNLARRYLDNWRQHEAHSKAYSGRAMQKEPRMKHG